MRTTSRCTRLLRLSRRGVHTSTSNPSKTILHVPAGACIYRFGDINATASPALTFDHGEDWKVHDGEAWAIIGTGGGSGKSTLFKTLLGQLRISPIPPPPHGLYPFLTARNLDPYTSVSLVSFAHRARGGSEFFDYSARYGAVRDEDRLTLRQSMRLPGPNEATLAEHEKELALLDRMGLTPFLDLPAIALSNGQTRKARIVKAVCKSPQPELLLMDEPLTGVDAKTRPTLTRLLESFHTSISPRLVIGLRAQDPIPEWISHIAVVGDGHGARVKIGRKADVPVDGANSSSTTLNIPISLRTSEDKAAEPLVELMDVGVKYGDRKVLSSINWSVNPGSRWHLSGANGSGKTTLLSLLTGDHPQSYSLRSSLRLFGKPRHQIATVELATKVGLASADVFDAFPRRSGVTVEDVIRMGFTGTYFLQRRASSSDVDDTVRARWKWEDDRLVHIVHHLGPQHWGGKTSLPPAKFLQQDFVALPQAEQAMALLMRALVGRPSLVVLDEVWAGMSEGMVTASKAYLRSEEGIGKDQAVIAVSHWADEIPWTRKDGLRTFSLDQGLGREVVDAP